MIDSLELNKMLNLRVYMQFRELLSGNAFLGGIFPDMVLLKDLLFNFLEEFIVMEEILAEQVFDPPIHTHSILSPTQKHPCDLPCSLPAPFQE